MCLGYHYRERYSTCERCPDQCPLGFALFQGGDVEQQEAGSLLCFLSGETHSPAKLGDLCICVLGVLRSQEGAEVPLSLLAKIRKSSCVDLINLIYLCFLPHIPHLPIMHWRQLTWYFYEEWSQEKRTQQFPVPSKTSGSLFQIIYGAILIQKYFILWELFGQWICPSLIQALIQFFLRKNLTGIENWASRPQLGSIQEAL